ncbi:hypothetical protein [Aquimonas voraii]|uniref:SMP-30/Gluconolaconase/LRE-like region-containing protein n=1 Tax=Aquimonas voraii TaxID=265719 RepID=A0A1G6UG41_9GAMM|nr:hypothetical protein [Aquimonas voraii]SDD40204.1 hypothetical protein SAMN04488509_102320 [Aquimonas voraii]
MRPIARRLTLAFGLLLSAAAGAQPYGYASGTDPDSPGLRDALYRVDLATGATTRIGYVGFRDIDGLALHPDGSLYGAADGTAEAGGTSDLLTRINAQTGAGSFMSHFAGLAGQGPGQGGQLDYGLAITCDGAVWLSSDTLGHLWRVDPATGAVDRVVTAGPPLSGLAARGSQVFGVSVDPDTALYRYDTVSKELVRVGPIAVIDRVFDVGLDFDAEGRLWALLDYLVPPDGLPRLAQNDLVEIDPDTALLLSSKPITGAGSGLNRVQLEGLAVAPPACPAGGTPPSVSPVSVSAFYGPGKLLLALVLALSAAQALRRRI